MMNFRLRSSSSSQTTHLNMSLESASHRSPRPQSINILGPTASQPLSVQTLRADNRAAAAANALLFNNTFARKLGWSHVACATICIVLGILALILQCQVAWLGSPLWSGLAFFLVAGIFGIATGPNDTCTVISFMVMSVMSAIVSFVMLIAMLVAASTEYAFCRHSCSAAYCTTICDGQAGRISVDVLVAVVGLIEFIISIISVSVSCRRTQATVSTQTVIQHFFPSSGGQVTIYTSGQNSSLMGDQQPHTTMPLHVYDHPTAYPITLPGTVLGCSSDSNTLLQPSTTAPPPTNPDMSPHPPTTGGGAQAQPPFSTGEANFPGVVLPPYSQQQLHEEGSEPAPPPFTSYVTPDTMVAPDGTIMFPFGASLYPTLPPPYQATREGREL